MDGRDSFAAELRRARAAAELSLGELACAAHVNRGYVGHVEHGERWPSRSVAAALDAALHADGALLATWEEAGQRAAGPMRGPVADVPAPPGEHGAPATGEPVDRLRHTIAHLVALDGAHGGAEVAPVALRSFRGAQRILGEGRYLPAVEHDLEAVTAELGELSGWLLFDAERHNESRAVNAEALSLAHIAGDTSMEWFVLSNQALASVHTGRYREALRISARMAERDELPPRVRALFDVRSARAQAALGDESGALRIFDRARSSFEGGTTRRDPAWAWWWDERELAGHQGMVHASLGHHHRALPALATAVERSEGNERFRWALYIHRANLLRACLAAGAWSEAERVAVTVAPMVGEVASVRTEGLLRRAGAHPHRTTMPSTLSDALDYIGQQVR